MLHKETHIEGIIVDRNIEKCIEVLPFETKEQVLCLIKYQQLRRLL